MTRDLGRLGEATLRKWAAERGLILNQAAHDASGWDFVLEWPAHSGKESGDFKLPLDKTGAPFQCLIQVKASDSPRPRPQVKLDNWLRFVGSPLPAFFLILSFEGMNKCARAYLIPVWEEEIRKILKRLRELSAEDRSQEVDLRKRSAVVKYSDVHRLSHPNGTSLASAVEEHVSDGIQSYSKRKLELLQKLGYEDGESALDVRFTIPRDVDPHEYLVDFALGLVPELHVVGGHAFDVRFGIRSRPPSLTFEPGTTLKMSSGKPLPAQLTASLESGDRVGLRMDAILPRAVGHVIDKKYMKILLKRPFVELSMQPYRTQRINYNFTLPDLDEEYALSECYPVAELIRIWTKAADEGIGMELAIQVDGKPLGVSELDPPPTLGDGFKKWAELVRHAWVVARYYEVDGDAPIDLNDLLRSADGLQLMAYILEPSAGVFQLEYSLRDEDRAPSQHCIPLVAEAVMAGWTFQIGAALVGLPDIVEEESGGKRYRFRGRDLRLHTAVKTPLEERVGQSAKEIRDEIVERYDEEMTVVLV